MLNPALAPLTNAGEAPALQNQASETPALAQTAYPAKPIRMIVPFSPGGTSDTLARILGQKITETWSQQVVVDARPDASGKETSAKVDY